MLCCAITLEVCKSFLSDCPNHLKKRSNSDNNFPNVLANFHKTALKNGKLSLKFTSLPKIVTSSHARLVNPLLTIKVSPSKSNTSNLKLPPRFLTSNAINTSQMAAIKLSNEMNYQMSKYQSKSPYTIASHKIFFSPDKAKKSKFTFNQAKLGQSPDRKK